MVASIVLGRDTFSHTSTLIVARIFIETYVKKSAMLDQILLMFSSFLRFNDKFKIQFAVLLD